MTRAGGRGQAPDFRVVHYHGPVLGRVDDVFECQARVVGDRVMIECGGPQAVRAQSRHEFERGLRVEHPVPVLTAEVAHQVVNGESEADLQRGVRVPAINRQQEGNGAREMRRQPHQQPPLLARFANQLEAQLLEVAQPAVDQFGRPAGRAAGEIARFNQRDFQTAQSRLARFGSVSSSAIGSSFPRSRFARTLDVGRPEESDKWAVPEQLFTKP